MNMVSHLTSQTTLWNTHHKKKEIEKNGFNIILKILIQIRLIPSYFRYIIAFLLNFSFKIP